MFRNEGRRNAAACRNFDCVRYTVRTTGKEHNSSLYFAMLRQKIHLLAIHSKAYRFITQSLETGHGKYST